MNKFYAKKFLRLEYVFLVLIVCFGGYLRFHSLNANCFWGDELSYVYLDKEGPSKVHAFSHGYDAYIRCYAHIVHVFNGTLEDEFTFRFLSAALGTLALILIYIAGKAYQNSVTGLCAAALFAINSFAVIHARIAHQYSSVLFGSTCLLVAMILVIKNKHWWWWLLLVLSSAFVFHVQILSSCAISGTWLTIFIYILLDKQMRTKRNFLLFFISGVVLLCLCLPEYIMYVKPSMSEGGRLSFSASNLSFWDKLSVDRLQSELLSRISIIQYFYISIALVSTLWGLWKMRIVSIATIVSFIIVYIILNKMKWWSNDAPPRYLCFLIPPMLLLIGGFLYFLSKTIAAFIIYPFYLVSNVLIHLFKKTNKYND